MDAKALAKELNEGFASAALAVSEAIGRGELTENSDMVAALLKACANNAAQALADRTISGETAERALVVNAGFDIEQTIKDEIFEWSKQ